MFSRRRSYQSPPRFYYRVPDMTSAHSANAITHQVKAIDDGAVVRIDVGRHRVEIVPIRAQARDLSEAIARAGFTPEVISATPQPVPA